MLCRTVGAVDWFRNYPLEGFWFTGTRGLRWRLLCREIGRVEDTDKNNFQLPRLHRICIYSKAAGVAITITHPVTSNRMNLCSDLNVTRFPRSENSSFSRSENSSFSRFWNSRFSSYSSLDSSNLKTTTGVLVNFPFWS